VDVRRQMVKKSFLLFTHALFIPSVSDALLQDL
jgi:hypothetical protein